jgi:hypothetical protein
MVEGEGRSRKWQLSSSAPELLPPRQSSKPGLCSLGRAPTSEAPCADESYGTASRGVACSPATVVLAHPTRQVGGDAGVQRVVSTAHDV